MAAPLPAPEPPPAIAPPAAPTTAPATAPMAPSFTVSMVLSRLGTREAACWLHAAMTGCVGTAGVADGDDDAVAALRGAVRTDDVVSAAFLLSESLPDRLATTSPVASAVAMTRAMPTAVSFQGLFQPPLLMIRSSCAPGAPGVFTEATAIRMPHGSGAK